MYKLANKHYLKIQCPSQCSFIIIITMCSSSYKSSWLVPVIVGRKLHADLATVFFSVKV